MEKAKIAPSPYQQAIYDAFAGTKKNINISAVAGSGKTTTLLELLNLVPRNKSVLFLAFNNSIVNELKERNKRQGAVIQTVHSCGWRGIMSKYGGGKIDANKVYAKIEKALKRFKNVTPKLRGTYMYYVPKLIDIMRLSMSDGSDASITSLCDKHDIELGQSDFPFVRFVFEEMAKERVVFDFTDMVYLPVLDKTIPIRQFDYVFCDESQDFSIAQQEFIRRCIKPKTGRVVSVGDKMQSIYGFAGADANSYERMAAINGESIDMPLSVSYRCAKSVIREAQKVVPYIQYFEGAPEGVCELGDLEGIKDGDWVVCRNVKPLVQLYIYLTAKHVKSHIKGVDICDGIIRLIRGANTDSIAKMLAYFERRKDILVMELKERGVKEPTKHERYEALKTKMDVVDVLIDECNNVTDIIELIKRIFDDKETKGVTLCSIHKSKGLEGERVHLLCPELIPSKYAYQPWQLEQEKNLLYVAITRAKRELYKIPEEVFKAQINKDTKK